jgi:hypothetical protein
MTRMRSAAGGYTDRMTSAVKCEFAITTSPRAMTELYRSFTDERPA